MMNEQVIQFRGTVYENGYGLIAQKVMRDKDLTPTAKSIYAYICSFAGVGKDGERSAFPGVKLMMDELGIKSDDTYYKHRKILIDKGYITIEKHRNEGKFENNIYYIEAVPVEKEEEKTPHPKKQGTDSPYPNLSSTDKSSTIKQGTIINSSIINSSYKEEEEYISDNEIKHEKLINFLSSKNYSNKDIKYIVQKIKTKNIHYKIEDIVNQHNHIINKMKIKMIYDIPTYFINGLIEIIKNNKLKFANEIEEAKRREEKENLYYNWLAE